MYNKNSALRTCCEYSGICGEIMKYKKIVTAEFISRPNRFVAQVLLDGKEVYFGYSQLRDDCYLECDIEKKIGTIK